jgi:hypothetical protein
MRFVVSTRTLSQNEVECSKPACLHNACRILFRNCGGKPICHCASHHREVWLSGGFGPRVINLLRDMDVCVELRAQAPVPPNESDLPSPAA